MTEAEEGDLPPPDITSHENRKQSEFHFHLFFRTNWISIIAVVA